MYICKYKAYPFISLRMKKLYLQLSGNYLLVEVPKEYHLVYDENMIIFMLPNGEKSKSIKGNFDLICMGDRIQEAFLNIEYYESLYNKLFPQYVKKVEENEKNFKNAFEFFLSEIKAKGCFWGANPLYDNFRPYCETWRNDFNKAELKTFYPNKTYIFEKL